MGVSGRERMAVSNMPEVGGTSFRSEMHTTRYTELYYRAKTVGFKPIIHKIRIIDKSIRRIFSWTNRPDGCLAFIEML